MLTRALPTSHCLLSDGRRIRHVDSGDSAAQQTGVQTAADSQLLNDRWNQPVDIRAERDVV
jgi:hypothetical protein